jgi:threonine dehydratase
MLVRHDIQDASHRLAPHIRRTPILNLRDDLPGQVALKLEFLQHSGSFKARGAFNSLLSNTVPPAGVAAASGGNHGAAVAYAAKKLGHQATIFVPAPTPAAKVSRIRSYGARVVQGGGNYAAALDACLAFTAQTGAANIHAYDEPAVLAGQGTIGLEIEQDAPDTTHVLVAVGGGGLIGGIASWFAGSRVQVVGIEPHACPTMHAALMAGRPVPVEVGGVAVDSLGARQAGALMLEVAQRARVVPGLVSDEAIVAAQAWAWERLRVVLEAGGATALAPLLSGDWAPPAGARVMVLLCGANVSRETLPGR